MGVLTTFLIRWSGGWTDLTNGASPRSEAFLSLGALQSKPEALRVAQKQLDLFGQVTEQLTVGVVADDADDVPAVPFVGFKVGDHLEAPSIVDGSSVAWRVGGISISENANDGVVTVTPTLITETGQWMPDPESAALQSAKKLANGTLGGSAKVAQPPSPIVTGVPVQSVTV